MKTITKEYLEAEHKIWGHRIDDMVKKALERLTDNEYVVWRWEHVPLEYRDILCDNGGDEDFAVFTKRIYTGCVPGWIERMSVDVHVYTFEGLTVFVANHG